MTLAAIRSLRGSVPRLVRVEAPHMVAGLELDDAGRVARAAPIMRWAEGRTWNSVARHVDRKPGWSWMELE